jgi:4-alpha-glucanotransferase
MLSRRRAGALLHLTSLPGPFGAGDLGPAARAFARDLAEGGFTVWQILPLGPTEGAFGFSPYASPSAFAGNPALISPEDLREEGWIPGAAEEAARIGGPLDRADLPGARAAREQAIRSAFARFRAEGEEAFPEYGRFREEAAGWLPDWCRFVALKERFGGRSWVEWPEPIRRRDPGALAAVEAEPEVADRIALEAFAQFLFDVQMGRLRASCREEGVLLFGDLPIYVAADGADVWSRPELFDLDDSGRPVEVAGVPPDYFSETGQRWGNPLYRWDRMAEEGFRWWIDRLRWALRHLDAVRIDHFRGFCGYWAVPAGEATAVRGRWRPGPGAALFEALIGALRPERIPAEGGRHGDRPVEGPGTREGAPTGSEAAPGERMPPEGVAPGRLPIVAEDLGVITEDVRDLMARYGLPGMRVLLFAFGGPTGENPHAPHNLIPDCLVYTGTHDNDTALGWWTQDATRAERRAFFDYLGGPVRADRVPRTLVRMALASPARLALIPLQDLLGLPASARMNRPACTEGNWTWRLPEGALSPGCLRRIREEIRRFGR